MDLYWFENHVESFILYLFVYALKPAYFLAYRPSTNFMLQPQHQPQE